jgi:hypothetical protein
VPRSQKEPNNSTFPKILAAAAPSFLSDFCNKIGTERQFSMSVLTADVTNNGHGHRRLAGMAHGG